MLKTFLTTCVLSLACTLGAQSYYMPSNTPTVGTCNVIPFGSINTSSTWVNQKYQCMATRAELTDPTAPGLRVAGNICEIAFAPCGANVTGVLHFDSIEIVLAQTHATSLSATFAANLSANVKTVLKAKNYDWHLEGNKWNRIGFDIPYSYIAALGANLVIQITAIGNHRLGWSGTTGFHRDGTHQRVYAVNWTGSPPASGSSGTAALKFEVMFGQADLHTFGVGCAGSNGVPTLSLQGSGRLGTSVGVSVNNCVANAVVLHVLGLNRFEPRIDLAIIGAPRCHLYQTTDAILTGVASSSGLYGWKAAVPNNPSLLCARIFTQVFPADASANNWGRTASNYGRILLGN